MKIEVGKTYKVLTAAEGYLVGDIFTIDSIEENEVELTFDSGSPFLEDLDLMEVIDLEETK